MREHLSISCAEPSLCMERWTQKYYLKNQRIFKDSNENQSNEEPSVNVVSSKENVVKKKYLTQGQKLKIGKTKLLEINSLLSELSTVNFNATMEFLTEVRKIIFIII